MSNKILVRFDDISPAMDWHQWQRAVDILEKYNVKPLLGVVPDNTDPELDIDEYRSDFWEYIQKLQGQGYAIAMHGCHHKYDIKHKGIINRGNNSEFAGHPYDVQFKKIADGKAILEAHGILTDVFFAPSHSYDLNTLRALAANGFKYMSDGKSNKAMIRKGIVCIPSGFSSSPDFKKTGYHTVVFHTNEWIRPEKAYGYTNLERLCREYSEEIVDFAQYVKQPIGNYCVQSISETVNMEWEYKLRPFVAKIYHNIRR